MSASLIASYAAGAVVDVGAAVAMVFPDRFSAARRYLPPFDPNRPEFKYGMRYGVPLMVGGAAHLGCLRPRRGWPAGQHHWLGRRVAAPRTRLAAGSGAYSLTAGRRRRGPQSPRSSQFRPIDMR